MSMINLLPDDYIKRQQQRRANFICMGLFVVVMAGVSLAVLTSQETSAHTLQVRDDVDQKYAEAAKAIEQMQQLRAQKHKMLQKAEMTAGLMERVPRSYILAMITNALPNGASLEEVKLRTRKVVTADLAPKPKNKFQKTMAKRGGPAVAAPMDPTQRQVALQITGRASTDVQVARFIANMARHPLTESVDLSYSEEKILDRQSNLAVRNFRVLVLLKPGADVLEYQADRMIEEDQDEPDDADRAIGRNLP